MAMTTYKYQRLADEFGVTSEPTLAAAVAAGNSTVQLAALCSTQPGALHEPLQLVGRCDCTVQHSPQCVRVIS